MYDFSNLKTFMDGLTDGIYPGNSIVVYKDGKKVFSYQSGYADLENKIPMRGGEMFNVYSCSKPATVAAALQLYEKGLFLLDDPLYDFIPEYRNMQVRLPNGELEEARTPITLRHLFTMTAGLGYSTKGEWLENAARMTDGKMNTVDVIRCMAELPLGFHPGTQWRYSMCHDVLAAVVEVISGERFADYMRAHIFEPLGMHSATFHPTAQDFSRMPMQYECKVDGESDRIKLQLSNFNRPYGRVVKAPKENYLCFGECYDSGGAGITATAEDYAKLANAFACGGVGTTGERILASGTVDLLRADQISSPVIDSSSFDNYAAHAGYGYGLGVMTLTDPARGGSNGSVGEFGWGGAAGGTVFADPARRVGYFYTHYMFNCFESYYQPRLRNAVFSAF